MIRLSCRSCVVLIQMNNIIYELDEWSKNKVAYGVEISAMDIAISNKESLKAFAIISALFEFAKSLLHFKHVVTVPLM